jgi:Molecular chaperone (small heat shock protein)
MLSRFNPSQEITTLRRAMDELFERSMVHPWWAEASQAQLAPIDVQETDQGYTVRAAVPGFQPEDLDVVIQQNMLTIRGRSRQESTTGQEANWVRREIRSESFERSLNFERSIDADKVTTSYDQGILTLTIPAKEAAGARHIAISGKSQIPSQAPSQTPSSGNMPTPQ